MKKQKKYSPGITFVVAILTYISLNKILETVPYIIWGIAIKTLETSIGESQGLFIINIIIYLWEFFLVSFISYIAAYFSKPMNTFLYASALGAFTSLFFLYLINKNIYNYWPTFIVIGAFMAAFLGAIVGDRHSTD